MRAVVSQFYKIGPSGRLGRRRLAHAAYRARRRRPGCQGVLPHTCLVLPMHAGYFPGCQGGPDLGLILVVVVCVCGAVVAVVAVVVCVWLAVGGGPGMHSFSLR